MRLGLLSTARINDAILSAAGDTDRVDVVAVASRDVARAEAYAREHGIARSHGSYEALLADDGVDAVYVSLPNRLHHEWTLAALDAGKHVLCEKPYSRRPGEVEEAFARAESRGLVLTEAFMFRHHPQAAVVKALVDDGAVGRVRLVKAAFRFVLAGLDDIRASPELDGGALMDVGCYCVSGSRLVAGEPEHAIGEQVVGPAGIDMSFHGLLRFRGDVVAQFDCSFALPRYQKLEVDGTRAASWSSHHGVPTGKARCSCGATVAWSESRFPRGTRTGWSSRTSPTRSPGQHRRSSAARTPSDRPARSTRFIAPRQNRAIDL